MDDSSVQNPEKSAERAAAEHRPGGRLTIANEDLFAYEPPQPFDAIFFRSAREGGPPEHHQGLATRFFRWLRPGGIAFVQTYSNCVEREWEGPFMAAGFELAEEWRYCRGARKPLLWHGSG